MAATFSDIQIRAARAWCGLVLISSLAQVTHSADPPAAGQAAPAEVKAPDAAETDARIAELIAQLGAEEFADREKAQAELSQLGLAAFDALHIAQNHTDPEVALRSRYLVRSMSVRWFQETDSKPVVDILKGYGDLSEADRKSRMDRLAALEDRQGVAALCRLSRFETVDGLSKYAALKVLEQPEVTDAAAKAELQKSIAAIVGNSNRAAATWLRIYGKTLTDPEAALPEWDKAIAAENEVRTKNPLGTTPEIVRDLHRFQVELLKRLNRHDEAVAVIRRTVKDLAGTTEEITEIVDWLMQREAWPVVLEVAERFPAVFEANPLLLYRLAETQVKLGEKEKAEAIVQRALALRADNLEEHVRTGYELQEERGLIEWAEREFREVMKRAPAGSVSDFRSRFRLAELLHDQGKELPAGEALKPFCDLLAKDEAAQRTLASVGQKPAGIISRMNYFFSVHYHEQKDVAKEREHLQTAIDSDPMDADVLIAMYRLPNADDAWKKMTREKIAEAAADFKGRAENARQAVEMTKNDPVQGQLDREELALFCNQYAWLVGNTVGDYDEAVKLSHLSLEMKPDYAGFLDTLGRCYFGKGDLENAIKYQSQAVKINPHSGQIRRQLEFFQKEQAAKDAKPAEGGAAKP